MRTYCCGQSAELHRACTTNRNCQRQHNDYGETCCGQSSRVTNVLECLASTAHLSTALPCRSTALGFSTLSSRSSSHRVLASHPITKSELQPSKQGRSRSATASRHMQDRHTPPEMGMLLRVVWQQTVETYQFGVKLCAHCDAQSIPIIPRTSLKQDKLKGLLLCVKAQHSNNESTVPER